MEKQLKNYRVRIYHFMLKFVKDSALAEDLTQDVMLKIWLKKDKLSSMEALDSYILAMAKNHIFDHFKKLAKEKSYQKEVWHHLQNSENRTESKLATDDIQVQLDAILHELPPRQQQIYELNHDKGLSLQEIADQLNIAPNTAKNHLTRALKVIRSQMNPESFLWLAWLGLLPL